MISPGLLQYPPPDEQGVEYYGIYPIDFILEAILRAGITWFREDAEAPGKVFGHLLTPLLNEEYGQAKIDEIAAYIRKYEITIVQSFSLLDERMPAISIQLLDASEATERAGLGDFQQMMDVRDADNFVKGRTEVGYSPVIDNVHIGIHTIDTPDLAKYLYYLVAYLLNIFKPEFERIGIMIGTYRATDISRLNDYLPENMYSRFVNFQVLTFASYDRGALPIIEKILGIHVTPGPGVIKDCSEEGDDILNIETGITVTSNQSEGE